MKSSGNVLNVLLAFYFLLTLQNGITRQYMYVEHHFEVKSECFMFRSIYKYRSTVAVFHFNEDLKIEEDFAIN